MIKKSLVAAVLGALLFLNTGCQTGRRLGKDLIIGVTSPYVVLHGASTDGVIDAQNIQKGFDANDWLSYVVFPFTFAYRFIDHTVSSAVYVGDILFTPFYALAEIHPDTDIQPIGIYKGTPIGMWPDNVAADDAAASADAETGEASK